jgi:hypothetical protein
MKNQFGVGRALKENTLFPESLPKNPRVGEIPIVSDRQIAISIMDPKWLNVGGISGRSRG